MVAELEMAKMEDRAVLDVVSSLRSLLVSIFGDTRVGDDALFI